MLLLQLEMFHGGAENLFHEMTMKFNKIMFLMMGMLISAAAIQGMQQESPYSKLEKIDYPTSSIYKGEKKVTSETFGRAFDFIPFEVRKSKSDNGYTLTFNPGRRFEEKVIQSWESTEPQDVFIALEDQYSKGIGLKSKVNPYQGWTEEGLKSLSEKAEKIYKPY